MSRVWLLSTNLATEPYPVYPLGMACVASALHAAGHHVEQFDLLAVGADRARLREALVAFAPDFVGLSMRNLDNCDSLTPTHYPELVRDMVALVKACTQAPVVLGGAAFSLMPEELLDFTGADYGVVGEGEVQMVELLTDLVAGRPGERIRRRVGPGRMASPLFAPDLVRFYTERSGLVNLQTKRGCPFACAYCSYPALEGREYRFRDPREVGEDLERLQKEHDAPQVFFTDSVFNDREGHYLQVVEEILRRELRIAWSCYIRPQGLGRPEVALMKRAGLFAAELGTDASTDLTLAALNKGFTFDEVVAVNEAFVGERLPCAHFVMFGGPGETEATVREGLANLEKLRHTVVFAYSGICIFPGTAIRRRALEEGLVGSEHSPQNPCYYQSPRLDAATMNAMLEAGFRGKRDRVFPPEKSRQQMVILQRMGYKGILWPTLIRYDRPRKDALTESPC